MFSTELRLPQWLKLCKALQLHAHLQAFWVWTAVSLAPSAAPPPPPRKRRPAPCKGAAPWVGAHGGFRRQEYGGLPWSSTKSNTTTMTRISLYIYSMNIYIIYNILFTLTWQMPLRTTDKRFGHQSVCSGRKTVNLSELCKTSRWELPRGFIGSCSNPLEDTLISVFVKCGCKTSYELGVWRSLWNALVLAGD